MLKLLILLSGAWATPQVAHCQMRHHFPGQIHSPQLVVVTCAAGEGCAEKWVYEKPLCEQLKERLP